MEYKDYYKILGIARDATQDEINRTYRNLTRKYNPDMSNEPDAEQKFKDFGEAYEVLKDPEKRAAYDQLGTGRKTGREFRPPSSWEERSASSGGSFTGSDASDSSDFFASLFGRVATPGQQRRTTFRASEVDINARIQIDLEDSCHGATRSITMHFQKWMIRGAFGRGSEC
jgi:curved DNA-binding protein